MVLNTESRDLLITTSIWACGHSEFACLTPPYSNVIISAPSSCPHPPLKLWPVRHMVAHVHVRACVAFT